MALEQTGVNERIRVGGRHIEKNTLFIRHHIKLGNIFYLVLTLKKKID